MLDRKEREDIFLEETVVDPEVYDYLAALGFYDFPTTLGVSFEYQGDCRKRTVDFVVSERPPFRLLGTSRDFIESKLYSNFASALDVESQLSYCEFICEDIHPNVGRYVVTPFPLALDDVEFLRYRGIREFRLRAAELTERHFALTGEWVSWRLYEDRMRKRYEDRDRKRKENPGLRSVRGRLVGRTTTPKGGIR